jgi:hypothetical protein
MWNHFLFCSATWIQEHLYRFIFFFSLSPRKVKFLPQHIGKPKDKVNDERFSSSAWEIDWTQFW